MLVHKSLARRGINSLFLRARWLCTSAADAGIAQLRRQEAFVSAKSATEAIAHPARTALERYAELLQERPLLTNAVTSGVLCALGDVLAQLVEWRVGAKEGIRDKVTVLDIARTGRMGIYGFFVCGPLLTGWYKGLNVVGEALSVSYKPVTRWLPGWYRELPGTSPARLLATKVVADSLLFQAPFLTLYFMVMGALEGLSPQKIFAKTKESFHQAWALSLLVWTPVQCVNLFYVPAAWQVPLHSDRRTWPRLCLLCSPRLSDAPSNPRVLAMPRGSPPSSPPSTSVGRARSRCSTPTTRADT